MDAIVAHEVRKTYGATVALDGVSLSVAAGEVFGLIGPNGAGKTTLVRALTGTTDPDAGEVTLLDSHPRETNRNRIGLLPQAFDPADRLTARELVAYYAGLYDEGRDPDAVLADVGLTAATDTRYENLSGGQKRRACVATALVNDPDVLFLDEPTTAIDPAGRKALWNLLSDLADGGTTIFLTTHNMAEAERLSDRVGLLADGKLLAVGSPDELLTEYGGEAQVVVETTNEGAHPAGESHELTPLSGEYDVHRSDRTIVIDGVRPRDLGSVVSALDEAAIEYESLTWTEPDLEDVYLRLTGEQFAVGERTGGPSTREEKQTTPASGDHR